MAVEQSVKGRARIYVSLNCAPDGMEPPKTGQVFYGAVEVKDLFEQWKAHLLLPDGYEVVGVYFDVMINQWLILIESVDIPLPAPDEMFPQMYPTYNLDVESGKVRILDTGIEELLKKYGNDR